MRMSEIALSGRIDVIFRFIYQSLIYSINPPIRSHYSFKEYAESATVDPVSYAFALAAASSNLILFSFSLFAPIIA